MPVLTANPWQQLIRQEISLSEAIRKLVDEKGHVNLQLLSEEVHTRFTQQVRGYGETLLVLPLLFWRGCFYLGSPRTFTSEETQQLASRLGVDIKIILISEKSYKHWFWSRNRNASSISNAPMINPLTGEQEQEDIATMTAIEIDRAEDQTQRIRAIITSALRNRASDIHLEPTPNGLRIRYRIDGQLRDAAPLSVDFNRKLISALKVMCDMDIAETRRPQDGRMSQQYIDDQQETMGLDLRVSTIPSVHGEKAVLRLLPQKNSFSRIEDLGFSSKAVQIYQSWLRRPKGVIILTGPTGSGKTSTLYTTLQSLANPAVNITTIEDPVEYVLPGITQMQVHEAAGMTLAAGLRAVLRQDPDIILVGEIRDKETAKTAVQAAMTGHLVFTTLHTNDALEALPRLQDLGAEPGLVSDALIGIAAQRLVRRICPHCAVPHPPTEEELSLLGLKLANANPGAWRRGKGCSLCFNSGYLGREAIIELVSIDREMKHLIREGSISQMRRYLSDTNVASFREAAIAKVTDGITTVEEILKVIDAEDLAPRAENTQIMQLHVA